MSSLHPLKPIKREGKREREHKVLLGLIEHYLRTGKPVGSNTLKEAGFEDLSSATIRNYFSQLEDAGYLKQLHSSGGRIPTEEAYKLYAKEVINSRFVKDSILKKLEPLKHVETREISAYLQQCAEQLSRVTHAAVFMSAPRFDHDFVLDVKLVLLDVNRCLCALITDFGEVRTEILHFDQKLSSFAVKRIENYFHWRLTGHDKPENLAVEEEELAQKSYNEMMMRYVVGYSHFIDEEVYRTGFSRLLSHPDFDNPITLANGLALFEHSQSIRLLIRECCKFNTLKCWIGNDLLSYCSTHLECAVLAIPYHINQKAVGAIGILGPTRVPYHDYCGILHTLSEYMSETLTRNIYKFKISFREPKEETSYLKAEEKRILVQSHLILLEDKSFQDNE